MLDSSPLHDRLQRMSETPQGLPLVGALTGFRDAGLVVRQITDALRVEGDDTAIVRFDTDSLIDYRSRRPKLSVAAGSIVDVEMPELRIDLLHDELGAPYLFLNGAEPDFHWERFAEELASIIRDLEVPSTTFIHSIPLPVPHTRPTQLTVTGNRQELVDSLSVWSPTTQGPAHALHLVERRLQERDHPVTGLVTLVPHYVLDTEFPGAAIAALAATSTATSRMFATEPLREQERFFQNAMQEYLAKDTDTAELVKKLEVRHDAYLAQVPSSGSFAGSDGSLPSADELAEELERYLANRRPFDAQN